MPRGRPPGHRITVYVPDADYQLARELAEAAGITLSTWLRNAALLCVRTSVQPPIIVMYPSAKKDAH